MLKDFSNQGSWLEMNLELFIYAEHLCSLCFLHDFMVDWKCLSDYPFAPLAKINAVCSLQLSLREGHDFNLLYMSQKAMACIKSTVWQISYRHPFLPLELVAYCTCPYSKAVQKVVLRKEFWDRWQEAEKKKGKRQKVFGLRDFLAAFWWEEVRYID